MARAFGAVILALVASGTAAAEAPDPALTAYLAKATAEERDRVAGIVVDCRAACARIGNAARPAAKACEVAVDRWALAYGGGDLPAPKHPSQPLHHRLFLAKLGVSTYALRQSVSIHGGADNCDKARAHLEAVAAAMKR